MVFGESFCFIVASMEETNSRAILTSVIKTTGDSHQMATFGLSTELIQVKFLSFS